jgi:hypothetical protein
MERQSFSENIIMAVPRVPSALLGNIKSLYVRRCRFRLASLLLMTAASSFDSESIDFRHWTRAAMSDGEEMRHIWGARDAITADLGTTRSEIKIETHFYQDTRRLIPQDSMLQFLFLVQFCWYAPVEVDHKSVTRTDGYMGWMYLKNCVRDRAGSELCRAEVLKFLRSKQFLRTIFKFPIPLCVSTILFITYTDNHKHDINLKRIGCGFSLCS